MDNQELDRTQLAEQQLQEQLLAGVQGNTKQSTGMRDQLREMFEPHDYVTIANPFDHLTGWAYVDPGEEKTERPDKTTKRTQFGTPKTRVLRVGEKVVVHGWEAYLALGRMFKEYAQKQGSNMLITLSSQIEIEKFLGLAYKGVFDPNAQLDAINAQAVAKDIEDNRPAPAAPVTDPLGFGPAPAAPQVQEQVVTQPAPSHIGVDLGAPEGDSGVLGSNAHDDTPEQGGASQQTSQQIEQNS